MGRGDSKPRHDSKGKAGSQVDCSRILQVYHAFQCKDGCRKAKHRERVKIMQERANLCWNIYTGTPTPNFYVLCFYVLSFIISLSFISMLIEQMS